MVLNDILLHFDIFIPIACFWLGVGISNIGLVG